MVRMSREKQSGANRAKEYGEALEREREVLQERSDALRVEFVVSEIELAITFCHSAAATRDPERSHRNRDRAEEAYSTAKHFLGSERVSDPMRRTVQEKISKLEGLLRGLRARKLRRAQPRSAT